MERAEQTAAATDAAFGQTVAAIEHPSRTNELTKEIERKAMEKRKLGKGGEERRKWTGTRNQM